MYRLTFVIGCILFVGGVVLTLLVAISQLPGSQDIGLIWFVLGAIVAVAGYGFIIIENYLRYRTGMRGWG